MSQPISDYAGRRAKSEKLRRSAISNFIRFVFDNPNLSAEAAEDYAAEYLSKPQEEQEAAILRYIEELKEVKTPGTTNRYSAIVCNWHKKNKIRFSDDFLDELKQVLPPNYAVTEDEALTVDKIRSIVSHSDSLLRAFILVACSSGARIGEILSLKSDDIEYLEEYDVYSFRLSHKQTKGGKAHRYFISHEAMQAIRDFLKVRPQYVASSAVKSAKCLNRPTADNDCLFVMSSNAIRTKLENATKKAGLHSVDTESNRARIHPHSFRKFADTQFKEIIGVNLGNELIGHDEGLSKSYRRYDLRQLAEGYKKIEPYVTIQAPADYVQYRTQIGGEVEKIRATLAAQSLELAEMKQRLEYTETKLAIVKRFGGQL